MAMLVTSESFWMQFLKHLGGPDHCKEFKLIARVDCPVEAEVTFYPEVNELGEFLEVTKKYRLVEVEEGDET